MKETTTKIRLTTREGKPMEVTEHGSLGLLALGYRGLMLWRAKKEELRKQQNEENNSSI